MENSIDITISETKDVSVIKEIFADDKLNLCAFDGSIEDFKPNLDDIWLLAKDQYQNNIGLVQLRKWNGMTYELHIMIKYKYHNSSVTQSVAQSCINYAKQNLKISNVIGMVPSTYLHVIKFCLKMGFEVCGRIKNGICLKNQVQDVIIFSRTI